MLFVGLALSILVGLSLGLLGGGGSILTVPVIHYVMGVEAHAAIATSLAVVGITSLSALIPHARAGRVRWRIGATFGGAAMLGAYVGGRVARYVPAPILMAAFGLMMLVAAIAMLRRKDSATAARGAMASPAAILVEGLVVGGFTGLVGAGGGFAVVPALVLLGGLPMAEAVGTSLLVIAMNSFAAFAGSAGGVSLDPVIIASVAAVAILGSVVGAWLSGKVPAARLRGLFGWFIVVMAVLVLAQEIPHALGRQVDWPWVFGPIAATLAVALAVNLLGARAGRGASAVADGRAR